MPFRMLGASNKKIYLIVNYKFPNFAGRNKLVKGVTFKIFSSNKSFRQKIGQIKMKWLEN